MEKTTTHIHTTEETHETPRRLQSAIPWILGFLLILAAGAGGYLLRMQTHPELKVQVMAANTTTPGSISATTTDTGPVRVSITTSTPMAAVPLPQTPSPTSPAPQTLGSSAYENPDLKMRVTLPEGWNIDAAHTNQQRVVFANTAGGHTAYIERYENRGETLESMQTIFSNSPEVASTALVTAAGQPALRYTGATSAQSGLVIIYKNYIYYFHGLAASPDFIGHITFL